MLSRQLLRCNINTSTSTNKLHPLIILSTRNISTYRSNNTKSTTVYNINTIQYIKHNLTSTNTYTQSIRTMSTGNKFDVASQLQDPELFKQQCYINGQWQNANNNKTIDVLNPATDELIGTIPNMSTPETKHAIQAAKVAFDKWKNVTALERAKILRKWGELMIEHKTDLGKIMTIEQGKPLKEAEGEVVYAAGFFELFSGEATRILGEILQPISSTTRIQVYKQPVGVVGAITPWNFPSAMITRKAGAALAAGCSIVLKPSEFTPYSAFALAVLAERAGVPPGVFNVLTGDAHHIGTELCNNHTVKKITFTGSTRVGKILLKQSADTVKRTSMELGGNAPFIIFNDADINKAVEGCIANKFRNAGQTCVTANRIYVQSGIYDKFSVAFSEAVSKLKVGNGLEDGTVVGPLINNDAVKKVQSHVDDAVKQGGKVMVGGKSYSPSEGLSSQFFQPTVVTNVQNSMKVSTDETFGPAAFLFKFETEQEAIKLANDTIYGLASYFYTEDASRIWRVSEALEYGMVGANTFTVSTPQAPFGGVKQSGLGREGSHHGINDYLDIKAVHHGIRAAI